MRRRVFGTKHGAPTSVGPFKDAADPKSYSQANTSKSSLASDREAEGAPESNDSDTAEPLVHVIAKISTHTLREERTFHICSNLFHSVDPQGNHIVRPVDLLRLTPQQGDKGPFVVSIFEAPGKNSLKYIDFGPGGQNRQTACELIPLPVFLDFAIGATECLEILHHGQRIVHGEIRGDAFHFDETTGQTRLINFGSGLRSFEHGLTSQGWSTLSREAGAKTKLSFISPEQTGRMPAEPDSRTDIYSLGILFWTLLTQKPAFDGPTPMDIIQSVLGRRLPSVSTVRLEVPDILGRIIAKMTAKDTNERYHSASGLHYDLAEVQKLLGNGDSVALGDLTLATKDVSSFFILPSIMIGRQEERDEIVKIIDKVSKGHTTSHKQSPNVLSSRSSLSDGRPESLDIADDISEHTSSGAQSNGTAISGQNAHRLHHALSSASRASSQTNSHAAKDSAHEDTQPKPWNKNTSAQFDSQSTTGGMSTSSDTQRSTSEGAGSISQKNVHKFRRKGRCEVISIAGAGGLGKSRLVHSVQVEARRRGYFASSKFDSARRTPFGPLLKLLSSLFKQVFSESDTDTPFHQVLKHYVRPVWPILHKVLGLPEFLLGSDSTPNRRPSQLQPSYNKSIRADQSRRDSASSRVSQYSISLATQTSQEFLRAGSATKSARLMNTFLDVLRVFAQYKFLCFCLDDLQFADDESLELISQLISSKMKVVLIVTYRPEEILPELIKNIIELPGTDGLRKHIPYRPQQANIC